MSNAHKLFFTSSQNSTFSLNQKLNEMKTEEEENVLKRFIVVYRSWNREMFNTYISEGNGTTQAGIIKSWLQARKGRAFHPTQLSSRE